MKSFAQNMPCNFRCHMNSDWRIIFDSLVSKLWFMGAFCISFSNRSLILTTFFFSCSVDCPLSKENQAPLPKFERTNGKTQNGHFFEIGQELVRPAHLKAQWSEFFEDLNRIKTNQNKWKSMTFLIVLHLKPKTLLYSVEFFHLYQL